MAVTQVVDRDKLYFTENVCAKCPGTHWGKSSMCRIYQQHIAKVESCPEWEKSPEWKDHDGQLAMFDLEPALEVVQRVEEEIKDYRMMVKEIKRLEAFLEQALITYDGIGNSGVARYGIEATLPTGKGARLATLTIPEEQYERQIERLKKLEEKVSRINEFAKKIHDEKERTVLECMLDGMRMNMIARHVGVSRQRLNEIKRSIVKRMAWELYGDELKGA